MIFYHISELMLPKLFQRCDEKIISFLIQLKNERLNWNFIGCKMSHFMIVFIPYINLLNLSPIKKCLFLRNMEPSNYIWGSKLIHLKKSFIQSELRYPLPYLPFMYSKSPLFIAPACSRVRYRRPIFCPSVSPSVCPSVCQHLCRRLTFMSKLVF